MRGEFNNFWCTHVLLFLKGFRGKKQYLAPLTYWKKRHLLSPFIFRKKPISLILYFFIYKSLNIGTNHLS